MPYPLGDINQDGVVDSIDLSLLVGQWGSSSSNADLNNDGDVDAVDLSILVGNWGATSSGDNPLLVDRESCIIFDPAYVGDTTQALDLQQDAVTTLNNGVTYTTDPDFTAMSQWPGNGDEVVPIPGTFTEWNNKIGSEITLVALARWDGSNNVGARLISQGIGTGPGEQQYELGLRSGGAYGLRSRINVSGTRLEVEGWPGSGQLTQNEAFLTAVTFDGTTSQLYVARSSNNWNIELVGSTNGTGTIDSGSTVPVIGNISDGWNSSNNVWSGQIGMTAIYSRTLSLEELQLIADEPIVSMGEGYTPPEAPDQAVSGLSVIHQTHNSVSLSWNQVDRASSYEIEIIGSTLINNITGTTHTISSLSPETTYDIRIRGRNVSGTGPWSDIIQTTTPPLPPAPASWQDALDAVIASNGTDEQPLISWYQANTGYQANVSLESLTPSGGITVTEDNAVIENLNISGGIYIRASGVTIRNCLVRGYVGGTGGAQIKWDGDGSTARSGTHIHNVTFDVSELDPPAQNIHAMRVWSGSSDQTIVEYCRVQHGPRSGLSASSPVLFRYNFIEFLDTNWVGHGRGIGVNSSDSYIHHNLVLGFTGSAAMGMYFDRWQAGSDGIPKRTTFEHNIGMNHNTNYHWQAANFDYGTDGISDITVRNNYWTIYSRPSGNPPSETNNANPVAYSSLSGTPGFINSPNYWLDGADDDPRPPPDGWPKS